ncbi:MAG: Gfo/Idh/MocA family oxidoreductase [Thermoguttaceae bacterium]|nr:Gfo/Idh/MocA family oxidoreductase [Thermoguttaceae bacterium]
MLTRRNFIKSSILVTTAVSSGILYLPASAKGANERIRVGVLGVGSRGNDHCKEFTQMENIQLAAVADPDQIRAESTKKRWEEKTGTEIQAFQDPRRIIEDRSIDAVSVASVNHWHSLLTLWSAEAGKHVYVEKPCSHTVFEGRQLVNAMQRFNVCIQHGTQNRSSNSWHQAAAAFRSGKYGKPTAVFAHANRPRNGIGFEPVQEPPATLNWDLWLGPADAMAYHANLVPYKWHWFWNTGDGEIGNNGVHFFDLCRLALGNPYEHARRITAFGTRIVSSVQTQYRDQGETPTIQGVLYEMNGIPCYFSSCNVRRQDSEWKPIETAQFFTDEGMISRGSFISNSGETQPLDVEFDEVEQGNHFVNFIDCVRAGTPEKLNAPIREGHYSAAFCHLGNISYRTGREASLAECLSISDGHPIFRKCLDGMLANVQHAIPALNIAKDVKFTLGTALEFDSATEEFTNCAAANALLRKPGRKEFVVKAY